MAPAPIVVSGVPVPPMSSARLLDAAQPIPVPGVEPDRWLLGIKWTPNSYGAMSVDDIDACDPDDMTNPAYVCAAAVDQAGFKIYDAFNASHLDHLVEDVDEILSTKWAAMQSAIFAKELLSGAGSLDASLSSTAHAPTMRAFGSAALSLVRGFAVLEDELARTLFNSVGMIHIAPGLLAMAKEEVGLKWSEEMGIPGPGFWVTPKGNIVVADAGYVDIPAPTGQGASGALEEWIYASGIVRYGATEPMMLGNAANEYTNISRNTIVRWLNAYGVLQFDASPVTAVLVSY